MAQWKASTTRQPPKTKDELRLCWPRRSATRSQSRTPGRNGPQRPRTISPSWPPLIPKLKKQTQGAAVDADPDSLAQSGVHKGIADADSCQAHRTRDHRGAASGVLSDRERERAAELHSANRPSDKALAQKYLLANWPVIEKMARDALAREALKTARSNSSSRPEQVIQLNANFGFQEQSC